MTTIVVLGPKELMVAFGSGLPGRTAPLCGIIYSLIVISLSQDGDSPLHVASTTGQIAVVTLLLDHGADIHPKNMVGYGLHKQ